MDLGDTSQEKIYGALRSLFRYKEMTEGKLPDILIELESELLEQRFALLNAKEIFVLVGIWQEYLDQQAVIEIEDEKAFNQYLMSLN